MGVTIENTDEKYAVNVGELSIVDPAKTFNPVKPTIITDGYEMQMNHSAYNYEPIKLIHGLPCIMMMLILGIMK